MPTNRTAADHAFVEETLLVELLVVLAETRCEGVDGGALALPAQQAPHQHRWRPLR